MKKLFIKQHTTISKGAGFAMLFTVLIVSLILSIAIGISNTTLKQTVLSSLAKDSQISFYAADTAIECGLYYDTADTFPSPTGPGDIMGPIICGEDQFSLDVGQSRTDYLVFRQVVSNQALPCSVILFDKETLAISSESIVEGRGYNTCAANPRQVERALQVRY